MSIDNKNSDDIDKFPEKIFNELMKELDSDGSTTVSPGSKMLVDKDINNNIGNSSKNLIDPSVLEPQSSEFELPPPPSSEFYLPPEYFEFDTVDEVVFFFIFIFFFRNFLNYKMFEQLKVLQVSNMLIEYLYVNKKNKFFFSFLWNNLARLY